VCAFGHSGTIFHPFGRQVVHPQTCSNPAANLYNKERSKWCIPKLAPILPPIFTTKKEVKEMPDFLPSAYTINLTMEEEEEPKQAKTVRFKEEVNDIEHAGHFGLYSRSPKVGTNTST